MPELPEVETIRSSMEAVKGCRANAIELFRTDIIRRQEYEPQELIGQAVEKVSRRGKFLIFEFSPKNILLVHLGMSGRFFLSPAAEEIRDKHVHFIVRLDNGYKLVYQDPRRFGGLWFLFSLDPVLSKMGPEPLEDDFTLTYLTNMCRNRKVAIKTLLLNQNLIAGLGNIYADESLFSARIRPERPAGSLEGRELKALHAGIRKVLQNSITQRGTTFRDYRDGLKKEGHFQNYLQVYGRENQACKICGCEIKKIRLGGRSSHFCEKCQK